MATFRTELRRARDLARRRRAIDPEAPVPPPLPEGSVVPLPGRGELFVRHVDGPAGGAPVVLLHGWTWTADLNWWPCYERLGRRFHVLAPDHRGHGRSLRPEAAFTLEDAADDVAALLDALGVGPAILVGYSMGGPIALLTAQRHPGRVAGLVLAATTLDFTSGSWWARARWRTLPVLAALIRRGAFEKGLARWLLWAVEQNPALRPHRAWVAGEWRRQHAKDVLQAGEALAAYDFGPHVGGVRHLPSAVVLTAEDRLVEPWRQRRLATELGATVVELAADHDANLVRPQPFAEAVERAVADVAVRLAAPAAAEPVAGS